MNFNYFLFLLATIFSAQSLLAQHEISGIIIDKKQQPIVGANIYIKGTYDGAVSDKNGQFVFTSEKTGTQILVISFLSFETKEISGEINDFNNLQIQLVEKFDALNAVIINAGNFEAGTASEASVLKPLDIVTTAGSVGNIIAALETLPGTQSVGEDGRLFVRGGDASETQTFIDGLRVAQPYNASVRNIPSRGRFSPYLFKGMSFSTGGYSAEYGNALSSVLVMDTQEKAEEDNTELSFMSLGLGIGKTKNWEKSSITLNASYVNLGPYQSLIDQNIKFDKPFQSIAGEAVFRNQFENGLLKVYTAYDYSSFTVEQPIDGASQTVDLKNNNFYMNSSYQHSLGNKWHLFGGISYGNSQNDINLENEENAEIVDDTENSFHLKTKLSKRFTDKIKLNFGAEYFNTNFNQYYQTDTGDFEPNYTSGLFSVFTETDVYFTQNLAAKVGVRTTRDALLEKVYVSPRLSLAYKLDESQQISTAYGNFRQQVGQDYLKFNQDLFQQQAAHYILNYQFSKASTTLRAEAYFKKYRDLLTYTGDEITYDSNFGNNGSGYAKGIDIFWRDGHLKNLDYWVSYSFIDSKRKYQNYPEQVTPNYVANHNVSIVSKYWVQSLRSQVGFTYNFNSGRPYNDPNTLDFMSEKTSSYHSLNFNWAYLLNKQQILYVSVSNILGTKNIFGYDYANTPNASGKYTAKAVRPTADRFFFVGFFWTISDNKNRNQLDQL
ncbi:TonB-dependent receptor [Zunongwangia profunda]|uniref:TonB-dependent receptor, plug n=3 Tax=Zunongwangia profunda TaxID=398743 RepID=D5BD71_ZUNPS|nr:TonB-dependent receptor [Zunongwangia profunda]ADF52751.1 TonB-dependent receptor, plug [Zunongwangia profunda SM-A87]|tara:strand:+ start:3595 stop:5757 length:2163 start_codon:yes stop_codon:yes gene_type:complete